MPTITHTPLGKVAAIWGSALIRDANGKMRVLKVDDEVKNGDVILTTQGGFVRINETEPAVADAAVKPATGTDVDRVIAGLNDGDLDIAPGAGLRGGDGGEFLPGLRVDRISESVTPGLRLGSEQEQGRTGDETRTTQFNITSLSSTPPGTGNVAPVADTGSVTGDEDVTLPVPLRGSDSDGSVVSVTVTSIPPGDTLLLADGTTQVLAGQTLTPQQAEGLLFHPAADFNGKTGITFFVTDNEGLASAPATVTINVTPVNDPPVALDDTNSAAHDTPVTTNVLANDSDPDGGTLSVTGATVTNPTQGSVVVNPDGTLTFTPANGFSGQASITYSISDGQGGTDSATLVVNVAAAPPTDVTTVTLSATASVTEGGSIVYTASVNNAVTGSDLLITLDNGKTITIPVGSSSASSEPVAVRADDVYAQGTQTVTASITSTTGGSFESLNTASTASTSVSDDADVTTVHLLDTTLDGSGSYFITASIDHAPQKTPLVLSLSNGASLTFGVGQTTSDSTAVAIPKVAPDSPSLTVGVTATAGGNFELLDTADRVTAPLDVSVPPPVLTPLSNPLGLSAEYYGYNDFNPDNTSANRRHSDDGTFGNLDSVSDVTSLINARNAAFGGSNVVGSTVATQDNATDVRFTATTLDYGRINAVTNSLGTNPDVLPGGPSISITRTNSELFKFINKTPNTSPVAVRITEGTGDGFDTAGTGPTSGLGKTSDAAMRFTGQAYLDAGLYDIRVTADDGVRLRLDDQTVAVFDGIQSATTRVYSGVAIEGGLTPLELLYWEQGGNAVLRVEFKLHSDADSSYKALGSSTLPLYSTANAPELTELQDIVAGTKAGTYAVRTGSLITGGAGDDHLSGGDARDHLIGGDGRDTLAGGAGADVIEGGKGDDQLAGGFGHDVFRWSLGDAGSIAAPAHDVISDFDNTSHAGDVLDLRDLLIGEAHAANTTTLPGTIGTTNALTITAHEGNLANYLHFSADGSGNTVIEISSKGGFAAGTYDHTAVDQVITLTGVNLMGSFSNDHQVINDLLQRGKLLAD